MMRLNWQALKPSGEKSIDEIEDSGFICWQRESARLEPLEMLGRSIARQRRR